MFFRHETTLWAAKWSLLLPSLLSIASGQPTTILNHYGLIQPGLPNYGIAPGSIVRILGSNMTDSTASQRAPLRPELAGVTVTVSVNGVTTSALPYSVSPGMIVAVIPAGTPVGEGILTVTSRGESGSAPIPIVESAFGIMTVAEPVGGGAAAIARDREGRLIDQTHPARAGERLSLWGSGLGAASNIPIEVDIGGTNASVTFHGRTEHPGLDRIDVVIPPEASGCNVSVVVVAGGVPSNFATIPIASKASRRSNEEAAGCSDPQLNPVTSAQYRRLLSAAHVRVGTSSVTSLTAASPQGVTFDSASATFERYTAAQFRSNSFLQQPSIGSCLVLLGPAMLEGQPTLLGWKFYAPLDAGPQLTVSGSDGSLALLPSFLQAYASSVEAAGAVNSVGALTLDNGSGGSDVGPFTASFGAIATPVNWTNRDEIKSLDRAGGQAITWTGGAPGSYVSVFGYSTMSVPSPLGDSLTQYIYFICTADATAGSFHIPTAVLNSLPPTAHGHLYVVNGIAKEFEAPGLDLGLLYFASGSGLEVPLL